METRTVSYEGGQVEVAMSESAAKVIDAINETQRGSFGYVQDFNSGKVGEDKCERPSVSNIWFLSNPRYDKSVARMVASVTALDLAAVSERSGGLWQKMRDKATAGKKDVTALFDTAKTNILTSLAKTEAGDRSDALRQAHDRCYVRLDKVTIHLATAPDAAGIMQPILNENGLMVVDGAMLPFYPIQRVYADKGKWGETDSRALTLMQDAIRLATKLPTFKRISMARLNFTRITFNSQTIYGIIGQPELDPVVSDAAQDVGSLVSDPVTVLRTEAQVIVNVMATVSV